MGVEVSYVLVARPITFRPTAEQMLALITKLTDEKWLPVPPGAGIEHRALNYGFETPNSKPGERQVRRQPMPWPVTQDFFSERLRGDGTLAWNPKLFPAQDLKSHFAWRHGRMGKGGDAYAIIFEWSENIIFHHAEGDDPLSTDCACGKTLEHDLEYPYLFVRIPGKCPACGKEWEPDAKPGKPTPTGRFICHLYFGNDPDPLPEKIAPEFAAALSAGLGCHFHEFMAVH